MVTVVSGIAIDQNNVEELPMSLMSVVFMPRKEVTNESGRKITVTIVKTMIALPWSSSLISRLCLVLSESGPHLASRYRYSWSVIFKLSWQDSSSMRSCGNMARRLGTSLS